MFDKTRSMFWAENRHITEMAAVSGQDLANAYPTVAQVTRPAEREQSQCIFFAPKILTEALVRDTGTLRVSNNFF